VTGCGASQGLRALLQPVSFHGASGPLPPDESADPVKDTHPYDLDPRSGARHNEESPRNYLELYWMHRFYVHGS
jgi:hypothetical protein